MCPMVRQPASRGAASNVVARAEGPERIAPEWWRHIALDGGQKHPLCPCDYYTIEDHEGAAYWVFRHGLYGATEEEGDEGRAPPCWFMHGFV